MKNNVFSKSPAWVEFFKAIEDSQEFQAYSRIAVNGFPKVMYLNTQIFNNMVSSGMIKTFDIGEVVELYRDARESDKIFTFMFDFTRVNVDVFIQGVKISRVFSPDVLSFFTEAQLSSGILLIATEGDTTLFLDAFKSFESNESIYPYKKYDGTLRELCRFLVGRDIKFTIEYQGDGSFTNEIVNASANGVWEIFDSNKVFSNDSSFVSKVGASSVLGEDKDFLVLPTQVQSISSVTYKSVHKIMRSADGAKPDTLIINIYLNEESKSLEEEIYKFVPLWVSNVLIKYVRNE